MSLTAVAVDRYRTVSAVTSAPYLARGRGGGGARAAATILAINTAAMAATLPYTLHMQVPGYIYTIYNIYNIYAAHHPHPHGPGGGAVLGGLDWSQQTGGRDNLDIDIGKKHNRQECSLQVYGVFLFTTQFTLPMLVTTAAYSLIISKLATRGGVTRGQGAGAGRNTVRTRYI